MGCVDVGGGKIGETIRDREKKGWEFPARFLADMVAAEKQVELKHDEDI